MGCGMGMIKYLLFIFNFIFALCGLAILVVGVLAQLQINNYSDVVEENISFPSITLIVIGCIIFVIAFFGCCGAIRESHCMTVTFASFLLALLLIQIAAAVYAFVVLKNSDIDVQTEYTKIFEKYWTNAGNRALVDTIQIEAECCGVTSAHDFSRINPNGTIPWSCCGKKEGEYCTSDIYSQGCAPALKEIFKRFGTILGGIAIGVAAVEFIGIIFALCLANSIRNLERRGYRV